MERDDRYPERDRENVDEQMDGDQMEGDTATRRDSQVRGSLGMPPSGGKSERPMDRDQGIPEFGRMDDEDRTGER